MLAGLVDKDRVAVIGGSHGGFLTGNLVGKYPDRFRCGVLRNPVMDISLMVNVSDIPDWCFVEATGSKVLCYYPSAQTWAPAGVYETLQSCLRCVESEMWITLGMQAQASTWCQKCRHTRACLTLSSVLQAGMTTQPTADQLARFRTVSPISHMDRVQAPLLFMLGAKDRR